MSEIMSRISALLDCVKVPSKVVLVHQGNILPGHDPRAGHHVACTLQVCAKDGGRH